jgi:hypothetical protein
MFDANTSTAGANAMSTQAFSSTSAVAATVTSLACAWFFVAGATMVTSPTDAQVARGAHVTVQPGPVMPEAQPPASVATAADAHFSITVVAHRA